MSSVLVIGGTGNMGRPLVKYLLASGYNISVVCRQKVCYENERELARFGGRYLYGNAKDMQFMAEVLNRRYDSIIDFCIYSSKEFRERINMFLVNTDQYVCLSTAAVYADIPTSKNESSPRYMEVDPPKEGTAKWWWYCYEKARIEDMLITSGKRNWTIVRPGVTMNASHVGWGLWWNDDWGGRIIRGQKVVVEKDILDYKFSLSSGAYVAILIASVIGNPKALGDIFNVCSDEVWSWSDLLDTYRKNFTKHGYEMKVNYIMSQDVIKVNPESEYCYKRARLLDRVFDNAKILSIIPAITESEKMSELLEMWTDAYILNYKRAPIALAHTVFMDKLADDCSTRQDFCSSRQYFRYLVMRYCPIVLKMYSRLCKG